MICFGLLLMFCEPATPKTVDSFCQVYQQVVQAKGEGALAGASAAKRRILANELTYRKLCAGKK